jgi:outer membrane immunogenic protein
VFAGPQGLDHRAFRNRVLIVKKIVLAVLLALGPASAFAADLPARTYTKASVAGPAYNWSGFYFGANGGYGFQDQAVNHSANNEAGQIVLPVGPLDILPQSPTLFSPRGAVGGAQAGYNRQFDRNWLVGVEADFDASWIRGSGNTNYKTFAGAPAIISADEAIDWFGTVRARLGFIPTERLLVFGTGGLAYGRVTEAVQVSVPQGLSIGGSDGSREQCLASLNPCMTGSSSRTSIGWSAGGGVEYALGSSVTAKLEYLHVDLGSDVVRVLGRHPGTGTPASANAVYSTDFNIVRAGVNYRF